MKFKLTENQGIQLPRDIQTDFQFSSLKNRIGNFSFQCTAVAIDLCLCDTRPYY